MENPFVELHTFGTGRVRIIRFDDLYEIRTSTERGGRIIGSFVQKAELVRYDHVGDQVTTVKEWADVRFFIVVDSEQSVLADAQDLLEKKNAEIKSLQKMKDDLHRIGAEYLEKLHAEEGKNVQLDAELEAARDKLADARASGWVEKVPVRDEPEVLF